ncbi:MAG TPA: hypothetical protein VGK73_03705 [Polyangiaceae bacterium]
MRNPGPLARGEDKEIDQLLARGRLSGVQYDEIAQNVLDHVAPEPRVPRWSVFASAAALAAGAAVWFVAASSEPGAPPQASEDFREKGAGRPVLGALAIGCGAEARHACRLGETLVFSVSGNQKPVFVVAYAERVDAPQARVWYFPHADRPPPRADGSGATTVLAEGVRLGAPHSTGKYRVKAWLAESELTREQAERLDEREGQTIELDLTD